MAARAYWKGQIRLALVSIPVEIFSATKTGSKISFNQIHEPSGKRINYEKVVQGVGPVDRDEIVKGYEISKGNYVILNDEEIEVRKAAVFALVDIYSVMGKSLMPHLSSLSPAQHKLLNIYIERNKENTPTM